MSGPVEIIERGIAAPRAAVVGHPIARHLTDLEAVRRFTEHHVWAVWGFMHLLNGLRRDWTTPTGAWCPPLSHRVGRIVNEIVLGEESDSAFGGRSHFSYYVEAMEELGADTIPIHTAVHKVWTGADPVTAARDAGAPIGGLRFLIHDWNTARIGGPVLVSAFTFGRETLIPEMFGPILAEAEGVKLRAYLDRHIEVDQDHGAAAEQLIEHAVAGDPMRLVSMIGAARNALVARRSLWDATLTAIMETR